MVLAYTLPRPPKGWNPSAEFMWSAEILRFYWFRLSDIAIPMGVAIGAARWLIDGRRQTADGSREPTTASQMLPCVLGITAVIAAIYFTATYICFGYFKMTPPDSTVPWAITLLICLGLSYLPAVCRLPSAVCGLPSVVCSLLIYIAIAFYAPLTILPKYADLRTHSEPWRSEPVGPNDKKVVKEWLDICHWIKENTPKSAKFWVPRGSSTFKWHAERSDIGVWKNIPQDAAAIVEWWKSMYELNRFRNAEGKVVEDRLLTMLLLSKTEDEITTLQQKYGFEYILCTQSLEMPSHTNLEMEYENDVFRLYRVLP